MAVLDDLSRQRLFNYFYDAFDAEDAGDMDKFVRNYLHNAKVWDIVADHFPTASASQIKVVMNEAYAQWAKDLELGGD